MSDRVNPTIDDTTYVQQTAAAIKYGGASHEGWIVPSSDDPGDVATDDPDIDETVLDAFDASHSSSTLDIEIQPGQAYIGGCWLARDLVTTITLDASTTDQTVFVGPDLPDATGLNAESNRVKIGTTGFESRDDWHQIWSFDTDEGGVTSATDFRNLDAYRVAAKDVEGDIINDHVERHETGGTAATETVTWDDAYNADPIVVATPLGTAAFTAVVEGQTTTDATLTTYDANGDPISTAKNVIAYPRF